VHADAALPPETLATLSAALAPFPHFHLLASPAGADPIRLSCQEQLERAGIWQAPVASVPPTFISTRLEVGDALFADAIAMLQMEISRRLLPHSLYCWKRSISWQAWSPPGDGGAAGLLDLDDELPTVKGRVEGCLKSGLTLVTRVTPSLSVFSAKWKLQLARTVGGDHGWSRPLRASSRVHDEGAPRPQGRLVAKEHGEELGRHFNISLAQLAPLNAQMASLGRLLKKPAKLPKRRKMAEG